MSLKPLPTMTMAPSEYHVWSNRAGMERTPARVADVRKSSMAASQSIRLEFDSGAKRAGGETFSRTMEYSHWRGAVGDIYSEAKRPPPAWKTASESSVFRLADDVKTATRKVGAHATGPGIGFNSKFYYRK